ncbi:hypothetical protein Tco_1490245 [Tanacetum coccineum]
MGITEGAWGFEHTKEVFVTEVIPFMNSLRESFKDFANDLHLELNEIKAVFNQMEAELPLLIIKAWKRVIDEYNESLELKTGLSKKKDMIEQAVF